MINGAEPMAFAVGRAHGSRATYMRYGCRCEPCIAAAHAQSLRGHARARVRATAGIIPEARYSAPDVRERLRLVIAEYLAS
jgi:hypothetical protein